MDVRPAQAGYGFRSRSLERYATLDYRSCGYLSGSILLVPRVPFLQALGTTKNRPMWVGSLVPK